MNTLLITIDDETRKQVDALTRAAGKPEKEIICEALAAIRRKFNNPEAASYVIEQIQAESFLVQIIEKKAFFHALTLFNPHGSKQNTIFDAVVAALAKELHADAIFSFDEWYKK